MGRARVYASDAERVAAHRARKRMLRNTDSVTLPDAVPGTTGDEAYTPPAVIAAARVALGGIDLDPASCVQAQTVVQAARWYGRDHPDPACHDGLTAPWQGRIWTNPPFSAPWPWVQRLIAAYMSGAVPSAVILLRADVSTAYSQALRSVATASCWPSPRLRFWPRRVAHGKETTPDFPTLIWYVGKAPGRFISAFAPFGDTR